MPSYSITVTLGTGDKGKEWDRLVRFHARKNRKSVGAFVRECVYQRIERENKIAPAPAAPTTETAQAPGV